MSPGIEFAHDIGSGIGRQADPGCRRSTARSEDPLRERSGRGMASQASRGWTALPVSCIARDYRTLQRVPESWSDSVFIGPVIVKIFVQFRGNRMLCCLADRVSCKTGSHPLAEACHSAPVFRWSLSQMADRRARGHSADRFFTCHAVLPLFAIRMCSTLRGNDCDEYEDCYPHALESACGGPLCE